MMIRKTVTIISVALVAAFLLSGCAHYSTDLGAFSGFGINDLVKARKDGRAATFNIPLSTAFDEVEAILKGADLTIYQSSRKKGYIVVIGFHQQIDTTRVGIFFDSVSDSQTKITLSSLSSMALDKAEAVIFGKLRK
jgi:hypothetical protein